MIINVKIELHLNQDRLQNHIQYILQSNIKKEDKCYFVIFFYKPITSISAMFLNCLREWHLKKCYKSY